MIFLFETFESLIYHVDRAWDLAIALTGWTFVAILYAIFGFAAGAAVRRKKDYDSMSMPFWGMILSLIIALPITVYWVG